MPSEVVKELEQNNEDLPRLVQVGGDEGKLLCEVKIFFKWAKTDPDKLVKLALKKRPEPEDGEIPSRARSNT